MLSDLIDEFEGGLDDAASYAEGFFSGGVLYTPPLGLESSIAAGGDTSTDPATAVGSAIDSAGQTISNALPSSTNLILILALLAILAVAGAYISREVVG